jgi:predicted membrane protein
MAWYFIVLIAAAALFLLLFIVYMFNLDMKLVAVIYVVLNKYHDKKQHQRDIQF